MHGRGAVPDPPPAPAPTSLDPATDASVTAIESILHDALTFLTPDPAPRGPGRPRILPATVLWAGLLVSIVRGLRHQNGVFRLLTQTGLWDFPRVAVTEAALYARLATAPTTALEALFRHLRDLLRVRLAPAADLTLAPFASEVLAIDETTLDKVARLLPALRGLPAQDRALFPGKLAAVFDLRRQLFQHVQDVEQASQNEKHTMWSLLPHLPAGALLVFDLGYFCYPWFDALSEAGFFFISRVRKKTSLTVAHTYYQREHVFDGLVWLGAHRSDQARQLVRLVRFRLGTTDYAYLTNVLAPTQLSLREIARLYQRRWDIELAFKLVKQALGLQFLWSSRREVLLLQVWGVLIVSQVLHTLQLEIATKAGVDPFDVSLPLLVKWAPRLAAQGQDPVAVFVVQGRALGFIRPSTRTPNRAPDVPPAEILPAPSDLITARHGRYAGRRCPTENSVPAYANN